MPRFDGTGPLGRGPLTGRGRGYCVLKIPSGPDEPVKGLQGIAGRPVALPPPGARAELARLRMRLDQVAGKLNHLGRSIGLPPSARE